MRDRKTRRNSEEKEKSECGRRKIKCENESVLNSKEHSEKERKKEKEGKEKRGGGGKEKMN